MSVWKTKLKAAIGPSLTRSISVALHGSKFDEVREVFKAFQAVGAKGIMIDVGAHFGGSLHPFAAAGWKIFAFEPDRHNLRHLTTLVSRFPNVHVDTRGISNRVAESAAFYGSDLSSGISGLSSFHPSHHKTQEISLTTLGEFMNSTGIQKVEFVKTDIEGHDLFALQGYPWDLSKPDCIVCEYEDAKTLPNGYDVSDIVEFLRGHGYRLVISEWYPVERYGGHHRWKAFRNSVHELDPKGWGNLVAALPTSAVFEALLHLGLRCT